MYFKLNLLEKIRSNTDFFFIITIGAVPLLIFQHFFLQTIIVERAHLAVVQMRVIVTAPETNLAS
jgi:hypothetical protein